VDEDEDEDEEEEDEDEEEEDEDDDGYEKQSESKRTRTVKPERSRGRRTDATEPTGSGAVAIGTATTLGGSGTARGATVIGAGTARGGAGTAGGTRVSVRRTGDRMGMSSNRSEAEAVPVNTLSRPLRRGLLPSADGCEAGNGSGEPISSTRADAASFVASEDCFVDSEDEEDEQ